MINMVNQQYLVDKLPKDDIANILKILADDVPEITDINWLSSEYITNCIGQRQQYALLKVVFGRKHVKLAVRSKIDKISKLPF